MPPTTAVPNVLYTLQGNQWGSPGRQSLPPGPPPAATGPTLRVNGVRFVGPVVVPPAIAADWSDSNPPWAYNGDTSLFTATWPGGTPIVDIQTGSSDFWTNLSNTVAAAGRRVVVRLGDGVYHMNQFRVIDPVQPPDVLYGFGFWFPNLQGLLGNGPDKTFVQMDANSLSTAQLTKMSTDASYASAAFNALQTGFCRFDGTNPSSPVLLAGITFRAADQQMITQKPAADVPAALPQPAPHQGVTLYYNTYYDIGYCRFQATGRAATSSPPWEMANLTSAQSTGTIHDSEFDCRLAPELNPARPRRCGPLMGNNEKVHNMVDVWIHHSNVSRYAMNDQNSNTFGSYTATRVKADHITDQQNVDPALNGGVSLGGWTNASAFGWESVGGVLTVNDSVIEINNPSVSGSFPAHFQLTYVGSRNPPGGRLHVKGNTYRHTAFPQLDGFCTFRIAMNCFWWTDGVATTLDVRRADNVPLIPFQWSGTWPPSAAQLAAANVKPTTHYIYKGV